MSCSSDCSAANVACVNDCAASYPDGGVRYRLCIAKCTAILAGCYALCAGEAVVDAAEDAAAAVGRAIVKGMEWLHDHAGEIAVGTIIVVGGIALIVLLGPGGGLVLAAA